MKKKRILLIIVFIALFFGYMGHGVYRYYQLGGMNVPIVISTQYSEHSADIEVYIDDKLVFKDPVFLSLYAGLDVHVSLGFHEFKAVIDGVEFKRTFLVFPVRYVYLEVQQNNKPDKESEDPNWVWIDFSIFPLVLM